MNVARNARVSFFLLFGLMGAYTLLETARDALFLSQLSTKSLPWAYLITAVGVSLVAALRRVISSPSRRRTSALLVGTALAVYALHTAHTKVGLYAVYSIVGIAATLLLVDVWTLVGAEVNVGDARRLFAWIAAGGTAGSILASLAATRLLRVHGPHRVLEIAAFVLLATAVLPMLLRPVPVSPVEVHDAPQGARYESYGMLLFWMVSVGTVATTFLDFAFKDEAVRHVSAHGLGVFFAKYNLILHVVELVVQVAIAPVLMRRVSADKLVLVLPALFVVLGVGLTIVPGLALAAALKIVDGSLRNSLHRTSTEVLYQPLPIQVRGHIKTLVDGVGQRVAQAVASIVLLGVFVIHGTSQLVAILVTVSALATLVLSARVSRPYVHAFLDRLQRRPQTVEGTLDADALARLLELAVSPVESRALAAVETLAARGEVARIPSTLVQHASPAVAVRVLELIGDRPEVAPLLKPLLAHSDATVRGAASRLYVASCADPETIDGLVRDPQPQVRASGLVAKVRAGELDLEPVRAMLKDPATRRAMLQAIASVPSASLAPLIELPCDDAKTQLDAARALHACGDFRWIDTAISLLHVRRVRNEVRALLVSGGVASQEIVAAALFADETPVAIRRHLPRTLSRYQTQRAATLLLSYLERGTGDGVTLHKALRGLGHMRSVDPTLKLERPIVEQLARKMLRRIGKLRSWRAALVGQVSLGLVQGLLESKVAMSTERLFRYLDLLQPRHDLEDIYRNLVRERGERRAASRELLEHVADPDLVDEVLAIVDDTEQPPTMSVADALAEMNLDRSRGLRALVEEHARREASRVRNAS